MPAVFTTSLKRSLVSYVIILLFLVVAVLESQGLSGDHIRLVGWNIILIWLAALIALFFQRAAGFPEWMDERVSNRKRFLLPLGIGLLFGLADLIVFEFILPHPPYRELPPFLQPFPHSIFLYLSGAIYVDVLFKLLPMTLIMAVTLRFSRGKAANIIFWISACILALYEPLEQIPDGSIALIVYAFVSGFAFNLLAIIFLRRYGWLAAMMIRWGHYLLWHILLGIYVEEFVIGG